MANPERDLTGEDRIGELTVVPPGAIHPLRTAEHDPPNTHHGKKSAKAETKKRRGLVEELQRKLWSASHDALLVVLQGLDTAGKDGTIRRVFEGVNPQGVTVSPFRVPTASEADHDFLWRIHAAVPPRGTIAIFNRSHYEDLVVPRVYGGLTPQQLQSRTQQVIAFEEYLESESIHVIKFFLNISPEEQQRRLSQRLDDPTKHWKFSPADLPTRQKWYEFQDAYDEVISDTSTLTAPWHIIPSNAKWYRDYLVLGAIEERLRSIDPHYPTADLKNIANLKRELQRPLPDHHHDGDKDKRSPQ
ncbi:MAG: PPK2 family polyphosphate kinase [Acidimicrobiales bacterium]